MERDAHAHPKRKKNEDHDQVHVSDGQEVQAKVCKDEIKGYVLFVIVIFCVLLEAHGRVYSEYKIKENLANIDKSHKGDMLYFKESLMPSAFKGAKNDRKRSSGI